MSKTKLRSAAQIRALLRHFEIMATAPFITAEQKGCLAASMMSLRYVLGMTAGPVDWVAKLKQLIRAGADKAAPPGCQTESIFMEFARAFFVDACAEHAKDCDEGDTCRVRHRMVAYLAEGANIGTEDMLAVSVEMAKMENE